MREASTAGAGCVATTVRKDTPRWNVHTTLVMEISASRRSNPMARAARFMARITR